MSHVVVEPPVLLDEPIPSIPGAYRVNPKWDLDWTATSGDAVVQAGRGFRLQVQIRWDAYPEPNSKFRYWIEQKIIGA